MGMEPSPKLGAIERPDFPSLRSDQPASGACLLDRT
jgi:hypothetical protein